MHLFDINCSFTQKVSAALGSALRLRERDREVIIGDVMGSEFWLRLKWHSEPFSSFNVELVWELYLSQTCVNGFKYDTAVEELTAQGGRAGSLIVHQTKIKHN